jgi:hypothetical protein
MRGEGMTIGTISIVVGVVLMILLKLFFKEGASYHPNGFHGIDQDELLKEDLDFDPTWAVLPSNVHHSDDD